LRESAPRYHQKTQPGKFCTLRAPQEIRLDWARMGGTSDGTVDLDYGYDANGNLTQEPTHDGVGGFNYMFTPENRMAFVRDFAGGGEVRQEAAYDPSGNRWLRRTRDDGGKPLLSLRDVSGQVATDYVIDPGTGEPELQKDYLHANGRLVAMQSTCGPRPALSMDSPIKSGEHYQFVKTDYADPVGDYTITIETDAGQRRVLTRDASLPDHFGIHEDKFFLDVTNWVRIQGTADCGKTGYSNAASVTPQGTGGGCLEEMSASRDNFSDGDPSVLKVEATIGGCDPSYLPADAEPGLPRPARVPGPAPQRGARRVLVHSGRPDGPGGRAEPGRHRGRAQRRRGPDERAWRVLPQPQLRDLGPPRQHPRRHRRAGRRRRAAEVLSVRHRCPRATG
jgi:hypothetical protein